MTDPDDRDLQPDVDSRNVPSPALSERGFPAPAEPTVQAGIGVPWLPGVGVTAAAGTDTDHPHLFHLQNAEGNVFDAGSLQGANSENWPILLGQKGAAYLVRLSPGGVREPHWHPSAWEINFVVAGTVRWSFVGPNSTQDVFEGGAGDVIFAPQGHFHYFENASSTEDLIVFIVFNSDAVEAKDDVGLAQSISSVPSAVLAGMFGVDPSVFEDLPTVRNRLTVIRRSAPDAEE